MIGNRMWKKRFPRFTLQGSASTKRTTLTSNSWIEDKSRRLSNFHLEANNDCLFRAVELSVLSEKSSRIEIQCSNLLVITIRHMQCFTQLNVITVKTSFFIALSRSLAYPLPMVGTKFSQMAFQEISDGLLRRYNCGGKLTLRQGKGVEIAPTLLSGSFSQYARVM